MCYSCSAWRYIILLFLLLFSDVSVTVCVAVSGSLNVSGLYGCWSERRPSQYQESQRRLSTSARTCCHHHQHGANAEERPSNLQSRLELLQSQLNRWFISSCCFVACCFCFYLLPSALWFPCYLSLMPSLFPFPAFCFFLITLSLFFRLETQMTADINVILQLLQQQLAQVPPAYSSVSPASAAHLTTPPSNLYGAPIFRPTTPSTPTVHTREPTHTSTNSVSVSKVCKQVPICLRCGEATGTNVPSPHLHLKHVAVLNIIYSSCKCVLIFKDRLFFLGVSRQF